MPVWFAQTRELRDSGKLRFVGLIQEQHPDRCALFLQWKQMDFPVLVDALNRSGVWAVPLEWAIDEHGILRSTRPDYAWIRDEFAETDYPEPPPDHVLAAPPAPAPAVRAFLEGRLDAAVTGFMRPFFQHQGDLEGVPGAALFRAGCAYRARFDSAARQPGDFQRAVQFWTAALAAEPQNYIFRRRIQQYGPLLDKPYPFYDWVRSARREIRARGEQPMALQVEPGLTESLGRGDPLAEAGTPAAPPDPEGRLPRDDAGLVRVSAVVVPAPLQPGEPARVHLRFEPAGRRKAHWDNEAGISPQLWLELPEGWKHSEPRLAADPPGARQSTDTRVLEFELLAPEGASAPFLRAYATYFVCEDVTGACQYLRQDLEIPLYYPSQLR